MPPHSFIEMGPGKSLTGMNKTIFGDSILTISVSNVQSLENLLNILDNDLK